MYTHNNILCRNSKIVILFTKGLIQELNVTETSTVEACKGQHYSR